MDFSKVPIDEVEQFAKLFFTSKQIGFMIGVSANDIDDFVLEANNEYSELGSRIYAARLKSEASIRQKVVDSAEAGSSNAQNQAEKYINNLNFED